MIKKLNFYYYGMMALTLVAGAVSYALIMKGVISAIHPLSALGKGIQYFVIIDAMCTIPFGLWYHKRRCRTIATMEDECQRMAAYQHSATLRIILVSNAMVFGIAAFYLMGAYQSMLWLAAIAAIGWFFTKPTEGKMHQELLPPSEENY